MKGQGQVQGEVAREAIKEPEYGHLEPELRLSFGIAGALTVLRSNGQLNKPLIVSLDVELSIAETYALGLRAATWLTDPSFGLGFAGPVLSSWAQDDLYFTVALGVGAPVDHLDAGIRGLGLQAEVGELWRLDPKWSLNLAPHFELVTPLLGAYDSVTVGFGLVLVATYR